MQSDVEQYANVAEEAVAAAIKIANANFGQTLDIRAKGPRGDVVTRVDHEAERLIIDILHGAFPDHTIQAEEGGMLYEGSDFVWLVDPLDGTNNYAYGLPLYGAAVTLCHQGAPIVSAIGEAHTADIACATSGRGLLLNQCPFTRITADTSSAPATALWIGYHSKYDQRLSILTQTVNAQSRRVYSTWAPTIDVFLYLRGGLDAIAIYQCTGMELLGSLLILQEAGAEIRDANGPIKPSLFNFPELSFAGDATAVRALIEEYRHEALD